MVSKLSIIRTMLQQALLTLAVLGYAGPGLAENCTADDSAKANVSNLTPEVAGEQAGKLLASINDIISKSKGYEVDMQEASEKDRLVLTLQMNHLREKVMGDINKE